MKLTTNVAKHDTQLTLILQVIDGQIGSDVTYKTDHESTLEESLKSWLEYQHDSMDRNSPAGTTGKTIVTARGRVNMRFNETNGNVKLQFKKEVDKSFCG